MSHRFRFSPHLNQALQQLRGLAKAMVHDPSYQPMGNVTEPDQYSARARFFAFYPPSFEQKAWLERCYRNSSETH